MLAMRTRWQKLEWGYETNGKKHELMDLVQLMTDSDERDEGFESGSLCRAETPSGT
jgi:hypothetical protein